MGDGIKAALITILAFFVVYFAHSMGESKGLLAGWNAACEAFGPQDDLNNCPTAFVGEIR